MLGWFFQTLMLGRVRGCRDAVADEDGGEQRPLYPSGGSISVAAKHFCHLCSVMATSEANLQDHMQGKRHARKLQYFRNMTEEAREASLQNSTTG
jgi:Zinc-finger of C2H2 type